MPALGSLHVSLESLKSPPRDIAVQGLDAIRNYFDSIDRTSRIDYLYEAKMVVVGRGFAGKTTLVRKLTDPRYKLTDQIKSTEGIDIDTWDLEMPLKRVDRFRFNIWDFGGQEKYDATHQFFITERTVYLFVTEARQESNFLDFDYWLNIIRLLGRDSPVIVVQNKIDVRKKSLPTERYRAEFPNILDFVDVSCADGWELTVEALRKAIIGAVLKLPQVGDGLPAEWVEIRRELEALDEDHIDYERYLSICDTHGLSKTQGDHLSSYFHDLGVIVHYGNDIRLRDLVVVNPDWAVDGVYSVLDTRGVEENRGRFTHGDLAEIWSDNRYTGKRAELLALMENYELCFELSGTNTYVAPDMLPANPPRFRPIRKKGRLTFIYQYPFMPAGLVTRLMVKIHRVVDGENFWRGGLVLYNEGVRASVIEDEIGRQVRIEVEDGKGKKELLAIIRRAFSDVYQDFNRRIAYKELVPCSCCECSSAIDNDKEPHYFSWKTLQRYASKGIATIRCEYSLVEIDVAVLIGEVSGDGVFEGQQIVWEPRVVSVRDEDGQGSDQGSASRSEGWGKDVRLAMPSWAPGVGAAFGGLTLLFFMALVFLDMNGRRPENPFSTLAVLALGTALSVGFLGGSAAARGKIPIPGVEKYPLAVGLTGGVAALVIVLVIGSWVYTQTDPNQGLATPEKPTGKSEATTDAGSIPASKALMCLS